MRVNSSYVLFLSSSSSPPPCLSPSCAFPIFTRSPSFPPLTRSSRKPLLSFCRSPFSPSPLHSSSSSVLITDLSSLPSSRASFSRASSFLGVPCDTSLARPFPLSSALASSYLSGCPSLSVGRSRKPLVDISNLHLVRFISLCCLTSFPSGLSPLLQTNTKHRISPLSLSCSVPRFSLLLPSFLYRTAPCGDCSSFLSHLHRLPTLVQRHTQQAQQQLAPITPSSSSSSSSSSSHSFLSIHSRFALPSLRSCTSSSPSFAPFPFSFPNLSTSSETKSSCVSVVPPLTSPLVFGLCSRRSSFLSSSTAFFQHTSTSMSSYQYSHDGGRGGGGMHPPQGPGRYPSSSGPSSHPPQSIPGDSYQSRKGIYSPYPSSQPTQQPSIGGRGHHHHHPNNSHASVPLHSPPPASSNHGHDLPYHTSSSCSSSSPPPPALSYPDASAYPPPSYYAQSDSPYTPAPPYQSGPLIRQNNSQYPPLSSAGPSPSSFPPSGSNLNSSSSSSPSSYNNSNHHNPHTSAPSSYPPGPSLSQPPATSQNSQNNSRRGHSSRPLSGTSSSSSSSSSSTSAVSSGHGAFQLSSSSRSARHGAGGAGGGSDTHKSTPQHTNPPSSCQDLSASNIFGSLGNPQFNQHILDEENLLPFYGIRQAVMRPVVDEDCRRDPGGGGGQGGAGGKKGEGSGNQQMFRVSLRWKISGNRQVQAEGLGRSKKDAKREAVKTLLTQLGPVSTSEYEQITKCMFSSLRGRIHGKQIAFPAGPNEHRFIWTFLSNGEEVKIEAGGGGSSSAVAEIAAMQDMYLKVLKYKDIQVEERQKLDKQVSQARQEQDSFSSSAAQSRASGGVGGSYGGSKGSAGFQLSKQDAGEINQQHHNLTARYSIKHNENVVVSAEGYRCTLEWRWIGRDGRSRNLSCVGVGMSKPLARASAALEMMATAGFIQHVNPRDRQAARSLVNLLAERQDPKLYVQRACSLIESTNSAVWRLFLPLVWRAALAENDRSLIDALLNTIKRITASASSSETPVSASSPHQADTSAVGEALHSHTTEDLKKKDRRSSSSSSSTEGGEEHHHFQMPPDIWEQLLDECTVLTNCNFGQAVIHELGQVSLDQSYFPSPLARCYFQNYRLMLALEWQAQLAGGITDRKAYGDMFEGRHLVLNCKSAVMPVFSLSTVLKSEDRDFLASVQFRENDCVLLRPYDDAQRSESQDSSWGKCFVGVVTRVKAENIHFNVNVRLASGEGAKHPSILGCRRFKLYYLSPSVTHDRMVEALRSLTMHKVPISQATSSYTFTPEIRYLLLHTSEPPAKDVAARGPVPFLSDVDPSLFDPLHQLNEAADSRSMNTSSYYSSSSSSSYRTGGVDDGNAVGLSSKKQRLQQFNSEAGAYATPSALANQVAGQARAHLMRAGSRGGGGYGPSSMLNEEENPFIPHSNDIDYSAIKLPTDLPLTGPQKAACLSALTSRLTLVQGPPGTGKTHVACAIIDAWQRNDPSKKILAVADSNVAADNLMEGLSQRGIRSVRVGNGSESDLQEEAISDLSRYRDYTRLKQNGMFGEAKAVRVTLFREAVKRHAVIIATCVGSGHELLDEMVFQRVIIDEGAQSIEPSNLIPLAHGCRNFVLIGDHKQLPPTILSPEAAARGLDVSLLERFVQSGIAPIHLLDEQRRMHPSIAYFPNLQFYGGRIQTRDVDDRNRPIIAGFRWPSARSRVCLIDLAPGGLSGMENVQGTSKYNLAEIEPLIAILRSVADAGGVQPSEVGVLTPYDAQKARLKKAINEEFGSATAHQIEVDSVDGFQGKEKDFILFSAVRSNPRGEIGFLKDPRRMNVMLTRAKRGVIVVGDQLTLWNDQENWQPWIQWVGSMRSIIPITRLNDHLETPCYTPANIGAGGGGGFNRSSSRLSTSGSHPNITGLASGSSSGMGGVSTASGGGMSGGSYLGGGGGASMMTNRSKQQQAFVPQGFQRDYATCGGLGGVCFQQGGVYCNNTNHPSHHLMGMASSPYQQGLDGGHSGDGGGVYTPFANNHSSCYMTGSGAGGGGGYGDRSLRDGDVEDDEDEEFSSGQKKAKEQVPEDWEELL